MTTAIVVMVGAGLLLVISAIENASIIQTFQVIWSGKPISTLGPTSTGPTGTTGGTPSGVGNNPAGSPPTNKK